MRTHSANYSPFPDFSAWYSGNTLDLDSISGRIKKLQNESKTRFDAAVVFVAKAAAVDTGAIERLYETDRGFTYAVAAQINAIDFIQSRRGDDFATHFQDQMNAHEMIVDFATETSPLVQAFVRQLHSMICANQETYTVRVNNQLLARPLIKGQYKAEPNTVTKVDGSEHHYCPVEQVATEMQRLLDELNTDIFESCNGIVKAAYIHHCLTLIHPFADGNGRVSRALASVFLIRDFGIPLLIFSDQRDLYYDALEEADSGKTDELVNFVYDRLWEAIGVLEDNITPKSENGLETNTAELRAKLLTKDSDFDSQLERKVFILFNLCKDALNREKSKQDLYLADLSEFMTLAFGSISGGDVYRAKPIEGFRNTMRRDTSLNITIASKNPAIPFQKYFVYDFLVPTVNADNAEIILTQVQPPTNRKVLYSRLSEMEDMPKKSLQYRLNQWAKSALAEVISEFNKNV